jgi:hypothetical protein
LAKNRVELSVSARASALLTAKLTAKCFVSRSRRHG